MEEISLKRIDVFTTSPFAGNPAGVVTRADSMTTDQMQSLAAEMKLNLIETAYLSTLEKGRSDFSVRFFTPDTELDFSGHVMLAACFALIEEGRIQLAEGMTQTSFETRMGSITVDIHARSDYESGMATEDDGSGLLLSQGSNGGMILEKVMIRQPKYSFSPAEIPVEDLADVLGIDPSEIISTGLPVIKASNEIDWLIIPVRNKETIAGMRPDLIKLGILNRNYATFSNQIYSLDTYDPTCITYSRNFSPAMGLWEDPASASGSAGLGAYLYESGITASDSMIMQQGNETDNLTRILVEMDRTDKTVAAVKVGGLAIKSIERKIELVNTRV